MKLLKIIILLSIAVSLAFSQELSQRVLITKTSHKINLVNINHTLHQLGVKMYVQTLTPDYYVYSASYKNPKNAQNVLKRVRGKFPYAKIVTIDNLSKANTKIEAIPQEEDTQEDGLQEVASQKVVSQEEQIRLLQKLMDDTHPQSTNPLKNFYINIAKGYTNINDKITSKFSNNRTSYLLEGGYEYENGFSLSLAYLNTSTSDISMQTVYEAVNYRYDLNNGFRLGGGILVGLSSLEINSYASTSASRNLVYGFDLAVEYKLKDKLYLFTKYQGFLLTHTININNTKSISLNHTNNILFGLGYKF